jgi:hypothetical protein
MANGREPDAGQLARLALEWLRSDEARRAAEAGERELAELARRFEQARAIESRELHEPFTV